MTIKTIKNPNSSYEVKYSVFLLTVHNKLNGIVIAIYDSDGSLSRFFLYGFDVSNVQKLYSFTHIHFEKIC